MSDSRISITIVVPGVGVGGWGFGEGGARSEMFLSDTPVKYPIYSPSSFLPWLLTVQLHCREVIACGCLR